jgi:hypothetical protein
MRRHVGVDCLASIFSADPDPSSDAPVDECAGPEFRFTTNESGNWKVRTMKVLAGICAGVTMMLLGGASPAMAQDAMAGAMPPPKVLVIEREYLKPGRDAAHIKTDSAFVSAFTAAKWPTHYLALDSMSGASRMLFLLGYDSFEDLEKDNRAMDANKALTARIGKVAEADGEELSSTDQGVYVYDSELSLHAGDVVHMRYFEITGFRVKPGHRKEFMELAKLYKDGYASFPHANWALFDGYYGAPSGDYYLAISAMKSLAEDDASMGDDKKFAAAMGPEKMKHIEELTASCIESTGTNLFRFDPDLSYADDSWAKADPFWKPKAPPMASRKPAQPAQ